MDTAGALDVTGIRRHFDFVGHGRVVTNNAASTQPARDLVVLYAALVPDYDNVHRGQSTASVTMTSLFERSYDTIAAFVNAPGREDIALYRNTTEAHNAVMYSLMTQVRDGDNIVTTLLEHNSNYVPWYALCREILPRFGIRAEYRLARFDRRTGALDLDHLASLVDERTKLVCCTGASNFLGTKPPLAAVAEIARGSGYPQPNGETRSWVLVDGAQLVPSTHVDVQQLDVDYLSFSFHKMLAPFGVGVLYAKRHLTGAALPFLYGGDMIADGRVTAERVEYNELPWKYAAGTPNILGTVVSAQALRLLVDLALHPDEHRYFDTGRQMTRTAVREAMDRITAHTRMLASHAMRLLREVPGITIYGPDHAEHRSPLVAFNVPGRHPAQIAEGLNDLGVESRAGCHCATLAHRHLGVDPLGSCRLSFYLYNTIEDVELATEAVRKVVAG
jgi:cysteine desulfurase/selenocysteine lyase